MLEFTHVYIGFIHIYMYGWIGRRVGCQGLVAFFPMVQYSGAPDIVLSR
jgi:hypothetical protein